jgi:cell division protein FtsN
VSRSTARDYKRSARRGGFDAASVRTFATGFLAGAVAVGAVALWLQGAGQTVEPARPEPRRAPVAEPVTAGANDSGETYDFYEMLPKFEVVVPEREREVAHEAPPPRAEQKGGVYVLQAGSYRREQDAERVRAQLALQGIDARVQRVAVDNDVWHRVRIGPIDDLAAVERLRSQLQAVEIEALVIRVGD